MEQRRFEHRGQDQFEVARREPGESVFVGDDFALLGDLDGAIDSSIGLGQHRSVRRSAAAPDRATSAVEQAQMDAVLFGRVAQESLRLVDLPLRGGDPAFFVGVRVAEHHLLEVAAQLDDPAVRTDIQQPVEQFAGLSELGDGLEQRDEADASEVLIEIDEPGLAAPGPRLPERRRLPGPC